MLLRKYMDRTGSSGMLLVMLAFLIAGVFFLHTGIYKTKSFFADAVSNVATSNHEEQEAKLSFRQEHYKVRHLRLRHKQLKTFLKKTQEDTVSPILSSWNIVQRFSGRCNSLLFKPGYYLFLFRLTLF